MPISRQLEAKNAATFAQITKDSAAAARTEAQIGEMLADFDKVRCARPSLRLFFLTSPMLTLRFPARCVQSMEILGKVDIAQLEGLQAKLIEVVPQ